MLKRALRNALGSTPSFSIYDFMVFWEREIFFWVRPVFQFRLTVLYQQPWNLCHRESKLGHVSAPSGTGLQRIRLVPSMSHA